MTKSPPHGLLSANDFLNNHLSNLSGVDARLSFSPYSLATKPSEGRFALYRTIDDHVMHIPRDLFRYVGSRSTEVTCPVKLFPLVNMEEGEKRWITFTLSEIPSMFGIQQVSKVLQVSLFTASRVDFGFFPIDSDVIREYRRRWTIENADRLVKKYQMHLRKNMNLGSFMTD